MIEDDLPVRLSHLLRDCSVGAIVRGPHSLVVVQDIRTWDRPDSDPLDREIRYVERVKSALGIDLALCAPPRSAERDGTEIGWIPALRFPTWMRCIGCDLLHPAPWRRSRTKDERVSMPDKPPAQGAAHCEECGGTLEQTPWILVHEDGYLADVPWHDVAHGDGRGPEQRQCARDWSSPCLKLEETAAGRRVRCTRCNSSSAMPSHMPFPPLTWQQPWIREPPPEPPSPDSPALLVEINDVRVHTPSTRNALVIPPESRIRRGTVTDRLYGSTRSLQTVRNARNSLARRAAVKRLADEFRCTPEKIDQAIAEIDAGYPRFDREFTDTDLLADEYRALTEEIPNLREDEDFVTEHHTREWKALGTSLEAGVARQVAAAVSSLVAVNRLKEVMAFDGFRRAGGEQLTRPDITGESAWLPALELYGEGIFFTLDEAMLRHWEGGEAVRERAEAFATRYSRRVGAVLPECQSDISPRFLLCHALSHLVIRELEAGAGYPAASLKERIYSATGEEPMAGVLIYVAVPDEEGSLGGLMELTRPHRFLRLLTRAFESAAWCSLDPVCSEQEGHGPDLLNRAACHACALIPETSCAYGNVLLDRTFVKGASPDIPAFLDSAVPSS